MTRLLDDLFAVVIDDVLSAAECDALVKRIDGLWPVPAPITTPRGFEMRPDIRNNERVIFDDVALAVDLFGRLQSALPGEMPNRDLAVLGTPSGLNERFRGYRYLPGQYFAPHFDGAFVRNAQEASELTVLLYLNDDFTGGATTFCDYEVRHQPRRGQALLFQHLVRHEGREVRSGKKYVLRSDVMYQCS